MSTGTIQQYNEMQINHARHFSHQMVFQNSPIKDHTDTLAKTGLKPGLKPSFVPPTEAKGVAQVTVSPGEVNTEGEVK